MAEAIPPDFGKLPPKSSVNFGDRLSGICALELARHGRDPECIAEMIERLVNSLAFTIAVCGGGDAKAINDLVEGAIAYLYETTSTHAPIARALK